MNTCNKCKAMVNDPNFSKQKKMCYACFRESERARAKIYWKQNKTNIGAKRAKLKVGKQDEINAYQRDQYHKNHAAYRKAINLKYEKRYWEDPTFRVKQCLKKGMLNYFDKKGTHAFEFIGCSQDMLTDWLQWQCAIVGLTFDDHGRHGWHIDHVVPCASFDLSDPVEQRACYNWTNLRPLPAAENISKSDTIDFEAIRIQELRYRSYLFIRSKKFDRTDITVGTVLVTTQREQFRLGTRGNDLGQVWRLLQIAALDAVTTPETWGQSAAKLLQVVIKLAQQLAEIRKISLELVRLCKL